MPAFRPHVPTVALLAAALLAAGCGRGSHDAPPQAPPPPAEYSGPPTPGDWLVSRFIADAAMLNPIVEEQVSDSYILDNVFPTLTDGTFDCEVKYTPELAASWEVSPDNRQLTYKIRTDGRWADGAPVTAEDVAFSYSLYSDPTVASPRFGYTEDMKWEIVDAETIRFSWGKAIPAQTMLFRSGLGIVPRHVLESADRPTLRGNPFNKAPLGSGPWKVKEWLAGEKVVLERDPQTTLRPLPHLERVVFKIIKEETTAIAELKTGNIDMLELSSVDPIPDILKSNPNLRLIKRGWRFMDYVAWNTKDPAALKKAIEDARSKAAASGKSEDAVDIDLEKIPPHPLWGSPKVRRALSLAINRDALIEGLLTVGAEKLGRPATGTITPELCNDYNDSVVPLPFDPEQAKAILAEEGWADADGDGVLERNGAKFEFTLNYNSGNTRRERGCVVIQSDLKKIGVKVNVQPLEGNVFFGNLRKKDYEAAFAGWSAALVTDPRDIWHSGYKYIFNFPSYSNARVDQLIEASEVELDDAKRREMYREMQAIIHDDQPYTFLYWMNQPILIDKRFRDVKCDVLSQYKDLHEWWVPTPLQKWTKTAPSKG